MALVLGNDCCCVVSKALLHGPYDGSTMIAAWFYDGLYDGFGMVSAWFLD